MKKNIVHLFDLLKKIADILPEFYIVIDPVSLKSFEPEDYMPWDVLFISKTKYESSITD